MTTHTDLADALREIADTLPLGSALIVRLAADRLTDEDGWIEWEPDGSDGPVLPTGTDVRIILRDGTEASGDADNWVWAELGGATISRYRVVK